MTLSGSRRRLTAVSPGAGRLLYEVVPLSTELTVAHGLNDSGVLVGDARINGSATRAVVVRQGELLQIGTLGGSFSSARGINGRGDVVGGALTSDDLQHHGFLYSSGAMVNLNDLLRDQAWEVVNALDINNDGTVVAIASREGLDRVVLLVPARSGRKLVGDLTGAWS